jgi:hypothetical protein
MTITRLIRPLVGLALLAALTAACTSTNAGKLVAGERTIYLAAIEPKGSTTVEKEPFPAEALPPGGGYVLKDPDDTGTWTVETYRWLPGEITVVEGDEVTLEILGVNGASHPTVLEGYDLAFDVKRGQLTKVTFVADKPGIFRFVCSVHAPSMTGTLVVLPAS